MIVMMRILIYIKFICVLWVQLLIKCILLLYKIKIIMMIVNKYVYYVNMYYNYVINR
jgi:hypothetical protein